MGRDAKKTEKTVTQITEELLEIMGVAATVVTAFVDGVIQVKIDGEDIPILIGRHGENLESLQLVLGILVNRKLNSKDYLPLVVEIGDWRKKREEYLKSLVEKAASVLRDEGPPFYNLPPMSPQDRRLVHIITGDHPELITESEGEEGNRRVVIKKAKDAAG